MVAVDIFPTAEYATKVANKINEIVSEAKRRRKDFRHAERLAACALIAEEGLNRQRCMSYYDSSHHQGNFFQFESIDGSTTIGAFVPPTVDSLALTQKS